MADVSYGLVPVSDYNAVVSRLQESLMAQDHAEGERDALAATLQRVRAVCDRYYDTGGPASLIHAGDLRAALDGGTGEEASDG